MNKQETKDQQHNRSKNKINKISDRNKNTETTEG